MPGMSRDGAGERLEHAPRSAALEARPRLEEDDVRDHRERPPPPPGLRGLPDFLGAGGLRPTLALPGCRKGAALAGGFGVNGRSAPADPRAALTGGSHRSIRDLRTSTAAGRT